MEQERFSALTNLPARPFPGEDARARYREESRFPVEDWAEPPYLSAEELEALTIPQGQPHGVRARRDREARHPHIRLPARDPVDGRLRDASRSSRGRTMRSSTGPGYPRRIKAADIPPQSRMMTIADIFDALVAIDRPYKKAESRRRARWTSSEDDVRRGRIDGELLRVFVEAKLYELPEFTEKLLPRAGR